MRLHSRTVPFSEARQPRVAMRIGVFLPNWIGDVVMATPAIRALRKHVGREGYLHGIMRPYVAETLAGSPWFDAISLYQKRPAPIAHRPAAVCAGLRASQLDTVVLLPNSFRAGWMAWRSGARKRIGYAGQFRKWLLTHCPADRWQRPGVPAAAVDAYLALASAVGCAPEPRRLELATTSDDEAVADAIWSKLGLPPGDRVVVINSGGAFGAAKDWPADYFGALARRIAVETDHSVLINCGPAERDTARKIVRQANHADVVSLAGERTPIGLTKACIARARLLVSTDSGPRFFAVAFGVPVVTLFGPTDSRLTKTYFAGETILSAGLDCQPCMQRTCPLGHHRCMRDLSVERVFATVRRALAPSNARPAA